MTLMYSDWDAEADTAAVMEKHPTHDRKAEGDGYEFYPLETKMVQVLAKTASAGADDLLGRYDDLVGIDRKAKTFDLEKALVDLSPLMAEAWTPKTEEEITGIIGDLTEVGARRAGAFDKFKELPSRPLIEKGMVASAKYYSNTYFNRVVLPSIAGDIRKKLDEDGEFDDAFFYEMRSKMDSRLKSVPHWRVVANQASSRSYHYGMTRAGMIAGYRAYRYVAVLDDRTTVLCDSLNGRSFWLADAVDFVEEVSRTDPAEVVEKYPWFNTMEDISELSNKELIAAGIMVPPLHANCRSTIRLLRN